MWLNRKLRPRSRAWDEQWRRLQEREAKTQERELERETRTQEREAAVREKDKKRALADKQTSDAQEILKSLDEILESALATDDRIDWESLKDRNPFPTPKPSQPTPEPPAPYYSPKPSVPLPVPVLPEPEPTDVRFQPNLGFLDKLIASRRERLIAQSKAAYAEAHQRWVSAAKEAEKLDQRRREEHESALVEWEREQSEYERAVKKRERGRAEEYLSALAVWEKRRSEYVVAQAEKQALIDERRRMYETCDPGAIVDYCDLVLSNSDYPTFFPQTYELDFVAETGILVVDYVLPAPTAIPQVKEVRYVQSRDELVEMKLTEAEIGKRYDSILYQVCLRTIHELFEADVADALKAVVFNGWVTSIDAATGKDVTACVLSVQAGKQAFLEIDLSRIEPKLCFRSLKGVGSSKLHGLAPVAPLLQINKQDRRFIEGREVIAMVDSGVNLAAMDWEDFEHLIRELFEAEFATGGGEVRVTQASRDGGVDAVAFDPDPIRGGKIVIQAKRYTNVVGVLCGARPFRHSDERRRAKRYSSNYC